MSATPQAPAALPLRKGIVKQVLSGDSVIIRGQPKNGPPAEKQINFSNVIAPKLARRPVNPTDEASKDEPWAWESREFLRRLLVGEEVYFQAERKPNINRDYGVVFLGKDVNNLTNVTELAVTEGLLCVRREGVRPTPELQRLCELEDQAKAQGKGRFSGQTPTQRGITWQIENPRHFVDFQGGKPVRAIIEHVRDGSTVRAFLLPDFQYITLMISGIRCPGFRLDQDGKPDPSVEVPFANEARFFVESRLLQRDVEILLESVNNLNFVGTILYPKGNIAEALLREGFAKCVDWSMAFMKNGTEKLRSAERQAKEKRLRLWKDYTPPTQQYTGKEKDFTGTVYEIINADAITVKSTSGQLKKVFLSSIRPPREEKSAAEDDKPAPERPKNFRPLYDIPWQYEAREFLRKKLVGKSVKCQLDYVSPARDNYPEKFCYTVTISGTNVAEAIVSKGYATVIRYRQDDDQRSSKYDDLLAAETQAQKQAKGVHQKKDVPIHRINDLTAPSEGSRIKNQYLPSWQRALRIDAIVEFVASGSRFRVFIPKESCLVTFLLAGITCPRTSRPANDRTKATEAEPFGEEAFNFVKERILQRDVSVHIDATDKSGNSVIGWMWLENNVNLSVQLVEEGFAAVHFTAEKSEYYRSLKAAEDQAKAAKKGRWANWVEPDPAELKKAKNGAVEDDDAEHDEKASTETKSKKMESVVITEVTNELHFFAQHTDNGPKLEALMSKLRQEFKTSPPVGGSYTPRRDDICASKFTLDNEWYRAKVISISGDKATVRYIDYGNVEVVPTKNLAHLPPAFNKDSAFATEYVLAWAVLPSDEEDKTEAINTFRDDVLDKTVQLSVEFMNNGLANATIHDTVKKCDIGKALIQDGFILCEKRPARRFAKIVGEYKEVEQAARKSHIGIWKYGDISEDNATEFG
jgi:staphylococcal nuclease domain-containing protein 1